ALLVSGGLLGWAVRTLRGWLGSPRVPPVLSPLLGGTCSPGSPTHSSPVRDIQGPDMSSQRAPQARRFPIEAGDCPSSAVTPQTQEPVGTERSVGRQLRRCPGSHCLTLPNVPIDVFIAMGGSGRPRTT
ncbi:F229A protein, partial [Oceanites oceanicus]|nr:F229A protein [Oceanites oceanicus]